VSNPSLVRPTVLCHACSAPVDATAIVCPTCGTRQLGVSEIPPRAALAHATDKRILPAFVLCLVFGVFGAHRFYVGKVGTGVLQLVTLGGLGIWFLIDLILIATGAFRDGEGNRITAWT
jgi:TM2 domain-containing membrane protein YozV